MQRELGKAEEPSNYDANLTLSEGEKGRKVG